jgi:hypothetical protein
LTPPTPESLRNLHQLQPHHLMVWTQTGIWTLELQIT